MTLFQISQISGDRTVCDHFLPLRDRVLFSVCLLVFNIQDYEWRFSEVSYKITIISVSKFNTIAATMLFKKILKSDKVKVVDIVLALKSSSSETNSDSTVLFSGHHNFL